MLPSVQWSAIRGELAQWLMRAILQAMLGGISNALKRVSVVGIETLYGAAIDVPRRVRHFRFERCARER